MNKNKTSTRFFSDAHEKSVCKAIGARQQPNSGATMFKPGDVVQKDASLLCECKCKMTESKSVSIQKEWLEKNLREARDLRLNNSCVCVNFGPDTDNYYIISENLMKFLVEKLVEENKEDN